MAKKERLFLLDAMALAYRAYFAFIQRPLINSQGQNTSAIYGFVNFLNRILSKEEPDFIAVVSDTAAPTFRHKAYKEYKATRQKMPEDMVTQLPLLKEVVKAYNIPFIELEGFEADDIMGTFARRAELEGVHTFLVTGDKDFMQLVSKQISIYRPGKFGDDAELVSFDAVREKFGVPPNQVIEVLGLTGDTSDNVPGVPGVGEKTAIPLIQKYGTIDSLYQHIEKIEQKGLKAKLLANKDLAFLSKKLVTIETNVPLKIDFHTLKASPPDRQSLIRLFDQLEFRTLAKKFRADVGDETEEAIAVPAPSIREFATITNDKHSYRLVTTEKELRVLAARLKKTTEFVFDTETTSTNSLQAALVGISFALQPREAFYISIAPDSKPGSDLFPKSTTETRHDFSREFVLELLRPILEDKSIRKIGHNLKYDMLVLSQYGVDVRGDLFDTMVASYVLRPDAQHGMDAASMEHLAYKPVSYAELVGDGKNQKHIRDVNLEQLSDYSAEDADITFRLYEILKKKLKAENLLELCEKLEFPLIGVLKRMEASGVAIDVKFLATMSKEMEKQILGETTHIHQHAGGAFNINSTQQLGDILFNRLKLPVVRKTKTGYSTDVAVLEALKGSHPIVDSILEYRQLTKLKSTYVDALPLSIHPQSHRIHTSFNQTVAPTGRLSSADPNLQNIPIRTQAGRLIRKAFVPGNPKHLLLSADYSQIELRIMAHISKDRGLLEAFKNHEDVHTTTAARVFGVTVDKVTKDMRRKAKEVNFGIMYGIGPFGLASRLEISQSEAKEIIARYFERFPGVQEYISATKESTRKRGYAATLLGRRRYLPDIRSGNQNIRQNAERQSINHPIQGTAADMIKLAMVRIDRTIEKRKLQSTMILQVHDELVFEVKKEEESELRKLVEKEMREALSLDVPIEVEIGVGKNWLEAH
jgi:DNA polymerase-1